MQYGPLSPVRHVAASSCISSQVYGPRIRNPDVNPQAAVKRRAEAAKQRRVEVRAEGSGNAVIAGLRPSPATGWHLEQAGEEEMLARLAAALALADVRDEYGQIGAQVPA